jgi:hypothetical protein
MTDAPQRAPGWAATDAIAAALTNSCMQAIARGLNKAGRLGGLGDSRALRAGICAVIAENLRDMDECDIETMQTSMGLANPKRVSQVRVMRFP